MAAACLALSTICPIQPERYFSVLMVSQLSELEKESIDYFVSFVQLLDLPKSIGQIYGLMFVSAEPLAMDDVIDRLELSKGSVSQGLATLKGLGAIIPVTVPGDRREHHYADLEISRIIRHFLEERLEPRLSNGEERLSTMLGLATRDEDAEALHRLKALQKWQKRSTQVLPLLKQFLKAENN